MVVGERCSWHSEAMEKLTPQPIDSAPKDGRWIIGWQKNFLPQPTKWHPYSGRGGIGPGWWGALNPTHWLPFPDEADFDADLA